MRRMAMAVVAVSIGIVVPAHAQDTTTRVSVSTGGAQSAGHSANPAVAGDGRYVAFHSSATSLVAGDTNSRDDIFVHDRETGATERVNLGAGGAQAVGGESSSPSISANGRFVAFASWATNLVANDTNNTVDVFIRDRQAGTTSRVSVSSSGTQVSGDSSAAAISADGRYVAFQSTATTLVPNDTNGVSDIFLRDLVAGTTVRLSVTSAGEQVTGLSSAASISADGRIVTFSSASSSLVAGDTNNATDAFVRDTQAGTTTRVSVGSHGVQANSSSLHPTVSGDGRYVVFASTATNLDSTGGTGIFIHDRQSGQTTPLAVVAPGTNPGEIPRSPSISGDGRFICFQVMRPTINYDDVLLIRRQTFERTQVSLSTTGTLGNGVSLDCAINHDGSVTAFTSSATNLVFGDSNGLADVFARKISANVAPTTMALDKTALTFGAVINGAQFVSQTDGQDVRLTQTGTGTVTWSATPSQPWLRVTPASGTGPATLSITVAPSSGLPSTGTLTATIAFSLTGAANTLNPITVNLNLIPNGTSAGPFGVVDTPADHRTGVTGAVPFTGWALDDTQVTQVSICRAAFGSETAPLDPNCGGAAEIFLGFAIFIDGARPDVAGIFATYPLWTRGGWGFMALTNMLPNQGNGTYSFRMRAFDREGHVSLLGTRTMTCANATATLPFGTIDSPVQGGLASGSTYINFGWALTPLPKTIPIDGSTIRVLIDGVSVGTADYNHARADIQAAFPGFNNTNGAVGFRMLNTTGLANGLHTISWTVTDDQGATEGIGSRFFTVSNSSAPVTAASSALAVLDVDELPIDTTAIAVRRGWDLDAPYVVFVSDANGATVVRTEEVSRVELELGAGEHTGYLRTSDGLAPLPIGAHVDPATSTFTWAPGVGFIGRYDLVFVRSLDGRAVSRREVRLILQPKTAASAR